MVSRRHTVSRSEHVACCVNGTCRIRIRIQRKNGNWLRPRASHRHKLAIGSKTEGNAIELLLLKTGKFWRKKPFFLCVRKTKIFMNELDASLFTHFGQCCRRLRCQWRSHFSLLPNLLLYRLRKTKYYKQQWALKAKMKIVNDNTESKRERERSKNSTWKCKSPPRCIEHDNKNRRTNEREKQ